jgi:hypothetical protein
VLRARLIIPVWNQPTALQLVTASKTASDGIDQLAPPGPNTLEEGHHPTESLLDRVEVRTVLGEEDQAAASTLDDLTHQRRLMNIEAVHRHDAAHLLRRNQLLPHEHLEDALVDWPPTTQATSEGPGASSGSSRGSGCTAARSPCALAAGEGRRESKVGAALVH